MEGPLTNADVLERSVPWDSYKTSGQISEADLGIIKRLDKAPASTKVALVQEARAPPPAPCRLSAGQTPSLAFSTQLPLSGSIVLARS